MDDSAPLPDRPPLRYASIDAIPPDVLGLERHDVKAAGGQELGGIDGFLIDTTTGQPRYVVIHAGGRVRVRRFVLPIEHTRFDVGRKSLRVDLDPDAIGILSVIPDHRIDTLQPDELRRYHDDARHACCPDDEDLRQFELERHALALPGWWNANRWLSLESPHTAVPTPEKRFTTGSERPVRVEAADQDRSKRPGPDHQRRGGSARARSE